MPMDVVDYEIKGSEMQFVEVELDPGEAAVGEAGSMMFMDAGIQMDTVFGDGSGAQSGFLGKLLSAGRRVIRLLRASVMLPIRWPMFLSASLSCCPWSSSSPWTTWNQ